LYSTATGTGSIPVSQGGTGQTASLTAGGIVYSASATAMANTAAGTSGQALISAGSSAPAFGNLALGTANTNVSGTLTVTNGGTGNASATAYALLAGGTTTTGAFQSLASVGTSGQILTSNGAGALPTFQTAAGGGGLGGQTVYTTAGSNTFTIPTGKTVIKVTVIGGGGGSGTTNTWVQMTGGGGGGGATIKYLTGLTPGNTLTVTVGAAGSAGSAGSGGGTGGTSSVASGTQTITTISATGGSGGSSQQQYLSSGGSGGVGSSGDINAKGGSGGTSVVASKGCNPDVIFNGTGGGSILYPTTGQNVAQQSAGGNFNGVAGILGGGASGVLSGSGAGAGAAGGPGVVIIEY
jgi:hypothetical protein